MKAIDLTGQKFGRLTVLNKAQSKKFPCGQAMSQYLCECDCGQQIVVLVSNLKSGHTKSCGCLQKQLVAERSVTHGMSTTSLYGVWNTMRQRCTNPNNRKYANYGGRGITVCDDWLNSFDSFYAHVSKLPHFDEEGYSLDRINNNGHYEPNNVRWATDKEQQNNKRNNRKAV